MEIGRLGAQEQRQLFWRKATHLLDITLSDLVTVSSFTRSAETETIRMMRSKCIESAVVLYLGLEERVKVALHEKINWLALA